MRKEGDSNRQGSTKKFLYTGPKSRETEDEDQWSFSPRKNSTTSVSTVDLEGVWSIKKNVGIGAAQKDKLSLNANKSFYSRHGGMKETSSSSQGSAVERDGTWTTASRGYSYTRNAQSRDTDRSGPSSKWDNDEYNF